MLSTIHLSVDILQYNCWHFTICQFNSFHCLRFFCLVSQCFIMQICFLFNSCQSIKKKLFNSQTEFHLPKLLLGWILFQNTLLTNFPLLKQIKHYIEFYWRVQSFKTKPMLYFFLNYLLNTALLLLSVCMN